jgi:uncharacterized protein YjbI with pentapeptide repeats
MPQRRQKARDGIVAPQIHSDFAKRDVTTMELEDRENIAQATLDHVELLGLDCDWLHLSEVVATEIVLAESHLHHLRIEDARIAGGNLANADWSGATCYRVEFNGCRMTGLTWPSSELHDVRFTNCKCDLTQFFQAKCHAARFEHCQLNGADFRQADLTGVVFAQCDLSEGDFTGATLAGADLRGCPISGMRVGFQELRGATIDEHQARELIRLMGITIAEVERR